MRLQVLLFTLLAGFVRQGTSSFFRTTTHHDAQSTQVGRIMLVRTTSRIGGRQGDRPAIEQVEDPHFIPIVDGVESTESYPIELPEHIYSNHLDEIDNADLFLEIKGISLRSGVAQLDSDAVIRVLEDAPLVETRRLKEYDDAKGVRTLAVIRITTPDAGIVYSAEQMEETLFNNTYGMKAQFSACSLGQLTWESAGVYDILVDRDSSEFTGDFLRDPADQLRDASYDVLRRQGLIRSSPYELADNVMFCIPQKIMPDLTARGANNWWHTLFADEWCLDLMAVMHELGHNLALRHSGAHADPYGDYSTYMSATGWVADLLEPKKCYNAVDHRSLGWFDDRTMEFDPITDGPRKLKLAAFTDTNELSPSDFKSVVLVDLKGIDMFQYNAAKSFNAGTEIFRNNVVVSEKGQSQNWVLEALPEFGKYEIEDFDGSGHRVVIEVCEKSNDLEDAMIVGVGVDGSACDLPVFDRSIDENPLGADVEEYFTTATALRRCEDTSNKIIKVPWRGKKRVKYCKWISRNPARQRVCKRRNDRGMFQQQVWEVCKNECSELASCTPL